MATAMAGSIAHLVAGLAVELAPIRVNGIFPGGAATEIFRGLPAPLREAEEARFRDQLIPRIADPAEVAQAYLYAMKCTYITGQVLKVDGGSTAGGWAPGAEGRDPPRLAVRRPRSVSAR